MDIWIIVLKHFIVWVDQAVCQKPANTKNFVRTRNEKQTQINYTSFTFIYSCLCLTWQLIKILRAQFLERQSELDLKFQAYWAISTFWRKAIKMKDEKLKNVFTDEMENVSSLESESKDSEMFCVLSVFMPLFLSLNIISWKQDELNRT